MDRDRALHVCTKAPFDERRVQNNTPSSKIVNKCLCTDVMVASGRHACDYVSVDDRTEAIGHHPIEELRKTTVSNPWGTETVHADLDDA